MSGFPEKVAGRTCGELPGHLWIAVKLQSERTSGEVAREVPVSSGNFQEVQGLSRSWGEPDSPPQRLGKVASKHRHATSTKSLSVQARMFYLFGGGGFWAVRRIQPDDPGTIYSLYSVCTNAEALTTKSPEKSSGKRTYINLRKILGTVALKHPGGTTRVRTFIPATEPPDPRRVAEGFWRGLQKGL